MELEGCGDVRDAGIDRFDFMYEMQILRVLLCYACM